MLNIDYKSYLNFISIYSKSSSFLFEDYWLKSYMIKSAGDTW